MGDIPFFFTKDEPWLEGCLPSDSLRNEFLLSTHWRMVLIGDRGAGMFNHMYVVLLSGHGKVVDDDFTRIYQCRLCSQLQRHSTHIVIPISAAGTQTLAHMWPGPR